MVREGPRRHADACETGDWSRVDVYLTKTFDYRALVFSGSRWDAAAAEWLTDRGATVVSVGGSFPGRAPRCSIRPRRRPRRCAADRGADCRDVGGDLVAQGGGFRRSWLEVRPVGSCTDARLGVRCSERTGRDVDPSPGQPKRTASAAPTAPPVLENNKSPMVSS